MHRRKVQKIIGLVAGVLSCLLWALPALAKSYKISVDESTVDFRQDHEIGFTSGWLLIADGTIDEDGGKLKNVHVVLDAQSITTHNEDRDLVVHSPEFFDTQAFPKITFTVKDIKDTSLTAEVTIKGVKKSVPFTYRYWGVSQTKEGKEQVIVSLHGTLNKKDFKLEYNVTDENGNPLLGDDLQILMHLVATE